MYKKLAELKVDKTEDYNDEVLKALEAAGFLVVIELDTMFERNYIIAKSEENDK